MFVFLSQLFHFTKNDWIKTAIFLNPIRFIKYNESMPNYVLWERT